MKVYQATLLGLQIPKTKDQPVTVLDNRDTTVLSADAHVLVPVFGLGLTLQFDEHPPTEILDYLRADGWKVKVKP